VDPESRAAVGKDAERVLRLLRLVVLLALVLPTLVFVSVAVVSYREAQAEAERRLERATRVAAEHALRVFDTTTALLDRVFDLLGDDDAASLIAREKAIHDKLRQMSDPLPHLQSMWVFGADGQALVGNRFYPRPPTLNVSDREFFAWHRAGKGGVYVTETLWGKVTQQPFFDLSRRRNRPDGSFAGLVSVGLHPDHFARFYAELTAGQGMSIALLRRDGAYIARYPDMPPLGTRLTTDNPLYQRLAEGDVAGQLDSRATLSGERRLGAFRTVGNYPLVVAAGIDHAAVFAGWRRNTAVLAAVTFPTALALTYLALVLLRRTRRELRISESLHLETEHRRRVEEALRQAQKLEAMGRLTGGVAHDFNNLLAVVNNSLYVLRRQHPDIAAAPQLGAIERSVAAGVKLTRQLLAFSRRQPLAPQVLSVEKFLLETQDLLQSAVGAGVAIAVQVAPDTAPVRADRAELELALLNLAVNARDALPHGGELRISARNEAVGGRGTTGQVRIDVTDTGIGIPPALLDRVFEPFFTTKPMGEGTGLGLAQVWAMCQRAGGSASITSAPGTGTTVTLRFPAVAADSPVRHESVRPSQLPGLSCRVLLVEDNVSVARSTQSVLEVLGCSVEHVELADRAREMLAQPGRAAQYDIVVSDISMPGSLDGLGLAEWLRRMHPTLPVVLMTGYAKQLDAATQQHFEIVAKPCPPDALASAMLRQLRAVQLA
jgi:signal transduction histidine kinase/ActR/RegA family two-component response regulator